MGKNIERIPLAEIPVFHYLCYDRRDRRRKKMLRIFENDLLLAGTGTLVVRCLSSGECRRLMIDKPVEKSFYAQSSTSVGN